MTRAETIQITAKERKILELVYRYKSLDTSTIWQAIEPEHTLQATVLTLSRLKTQKLLLRTTGRPGPTVYRLTERGGGAIGRKLGSQHRRQPGKSVLEWRRVQVELESTATRLGYFCCQPETVAPGSRKNSRNSEVRKLVLEHYLAVEMARLNQPEARTRPDYRERMENLVAQVTPVPARFNDYYLFRPGYTGVVVLLSGIRTTRRYWQKRVEEYRGLARDLPVLAVFHKKPPEDLIQNLKQVGFLIILAENLEAFLAKYLPDKCLKLPPPSN